MNVYNSSMLSETESSGEFEHILSLSRIESNLLRIDSCLSRIDSNIHRIDSNISRVDSSENNLNKLNEENNDDNKEENKNNYILNSYNNNFQLGYRGNQMKKNSNKLSLFGSIKKSDNIVNDMEKKNSLFQANINNINNKENSNSEEMENESSSNLDKSSDSSNEQNILLHNNEEEKGNDNKKGNEKDKKHEKEKVGESNFFLKKNISKQIDNDNNGNENENDNNDNIIIHSIDSSESNDDSFFEEEEEESETKELEELLPDIIYIKSKGLYNFNYQQFSNLFNELMNEVDGKSNKKDYKSNKSVLFLNENAEQDKDFFNKNNKFNKSCSINMSSIKTKYINDSNNNKDTNKDEKQIKSDINDNQIKVSKFKLILPIFCWTI